MNFSDENSEEDFEDWDSIGLNVSKPPNLIRLFRDYKRSAVPATKVTHERSIQTSEDEEFRQKQLQQMSMLESQVEQSQVKLAEQDKCIEQLKEQLSNTTSKCELLEKESKERNITDVRIANDLEEEEEESLPVLEVASLKTEQFCRKTIPQSFLEHISKKCCPDMPKNNSVSMLSESSFEKVIDILSTSLPKIVPNVLLAKRDELIPLLLLSIQYNIDERCRDELLHLLFNLIKRPDTEQRHVIVAGFKKIAEIFPNRIESELMPQIWEQLSHKYVERRILIAETCTWLLPHIPEELRNSLVYSILIQLIEDRDVQVRKIMKFGKTYLLLK
jgi:hypothetical protein